MQQTYINHRNKELYNIDIHGNKNIHKDINTHIQYIHL